MSKVPGIIWIRTKSRLPTKEEAAEFYSTHLVWYTENGRVFLDTIRSAENYDWWMPVTIPHSNGSFSEQS
jgi:hypothetical protein